MKILYFNSYRMLSRNSSKPDVRSNFKRYLHNLGHHFDAICLAESSSSKIGINDLLSDYQIYESDLRNTRLYQHGYKFAVAYRGGCIVKPLNYLTDDFPNQEFLELSENKGYCLEHLFSIKLGEIDVVTVHIQAVDSSKEMKELSKYSQKAGLAKLSNYMKEHNPDIVVGDFNLQNSRLLSKFRDTNFDVDNSGYSFVSSLDQDVNGSKIHHALSRRNDVCIKYINEVQTHLTTAIYIEIN